MTVDEMVERMLDLDIKVTPEVEDAFYFVRMLEEEGKKDLDEGNDSESVEEYEEKLKNYYDPANNAGKRVAELPSDVRLDAIRKAYKMLDNIKKYGVPCSEWQ